MPEPLIESQDRMNRPAMNLLLLCARARITPEISDRIRAAVQQDVNWIALIRLALRHDVMPRLYRSLQQVCPDAVPEGILAPLRARYEAQAAQARRHAEELVRIVSLFEEQGIRAVPYKGPTLAQRFYGDLSLREFGDLDIMILERDVPRAQDLIRSHGYRFVYLKDADQLSQYVRTNRELQFEGPDGLRLELHWRFALQLACVKHDPERFLERLETVSLGGAQVPSLTLEVYFLVLSVHGTKHMWRQLKLISDIAEILGHADLDWRYVLREADDLGLQRMLAVAALLAEDTLGVVAPRELAQGLRIDRTARALAAQVGRSFFEEPDKNWHAQADFPFQYKIRERLRDRGQNVGSEFAVQTCAR